MTRLNPDATLDVIITNIHSFYLPPTTLAPLDNDENVTGKPADHLIVVMKPLSAEFPVYRKRYKTIKYRPFPDSAMREMGQWVQAQSWQEIYSIPCPSLKADKFEQMIMDKVDLLFPEESIRLNENDKPWVDSQLLNLDRQCKREYNKNTRSEKWSWLYETFSERAENLKEWYYVNMVEDLKTSNIGQWYSKVKRMSSIDPTKNEHVSVQDIMDVPSETQAELIADNFSEISHLYQPLKSEDIQIPSLENSKPVPLFEPYQVYEKIKKMKKKASTVCGDIPWKVISEFSV